MASPFDKCPVCDGQGGWDKYTSGPRKRAVLNDDSWIKCVFCDGTGIKPPPVKGFDK